MALGLIINGFSKLKLLLARKFSRPNAKVVDCTGDDPDRIEGIPFYIEYDFQDRFKAIRAKNALTETFLHGISTFSQSELMHGLICKAALLDPNIGCLAGEVESYCAPWYDGDYPAIDAARKLIPAGPFASVVVMPHGKMGGADLVAGVLATCLSCDGRVLILRTEASDWDRPDWYPEGVPSVDLSQVLKQHAPRGRLLYVILNEIRPSRIYNVNSKLAFDMFVDYGARLSKHFKLYAYYFCSDRTPEGLEVGYPVWYFSSVLPHLEKAFTDTKYLIDTLTYRYGLPSSLANRLCCLYTPALTATKKSILQAKSHLRANSRPHLLWANRLDRQKRFDLVIEIAKMMPDVDISCWGKAVLDDPPDITRLPVNLKMHKPFLSYEELPFETADGWLYTSEWDGLPTILIEIGARGLPIVASAVGGVPELIDRQTGWPVSSNDAASFVVAIREMLNEPDERLTRASALQTLVCRRHSMNGYKGQLRDAHI